MPNPQPALTNVMSTANFWSDTFTFDPLVAGDTIAQSANIAGALGVLKRGTVLFGPVGPAPITNTTLLTTVPTGASARVILAQDIDTTGGQVTGLVYTQGKFLDTAITFSSNGAASDCAALWDYGIYVLTVEQRSGILVPMMKLPATGGPLPQSLSPKDAAAAFKAEVDAIKAATPADLQAKLAAWKPPAGQAPYAAAAFGETAPTAEQKAELEAAEAAGDLEAKQAKELADLQAKQQKELSELLAKQSKEAEALIEKETKAEQKAEGKPESKEGESKPEPRSGLPPHKR